MYALPVKRMLESALRARGSSIEDRLWRGKQKSWNNGLLLMFAFGEDSEDRLGRGKLKSWNNVCS